MEKLSAETRADNARSKKAFTKMVASARRKGAVIEVKYYEKPAAKQQHFPLFNKLK